MSFHQIVNSVGALLGSTLAASVTKDNAIPDAKERSFPPLASPREGSSITDTLWAKGDAIATQVAKYVLDNFEALTGCGTDPTDGCAEQYVASFAERAFRRPLTGDESTRLAQVYSEVKATGLSVNEAVQYSVSAVLGAPQFLYRTEFGENSLAEGPLSPYEIASELAFFVTDAPPDAELLDAAKQARLSTVDEIARQVARLLDTAAAKQNLENAMFAYFGSAIVKDIVLPDVSDFTVGLRDSIVMESELFLHHTLWSGKASDLLTSRRAFLNDELARNVYRVAWPPAGVSLDANGFGPVDLPDTRAGILTQPGYLLRYTSSIPTARVVPRGMLVSETIVCTGRPLHDNTGSAGPINEKLKGETEKTKAEYRANNLPCSGCHLPIDPYGLALERFDLLGRYRTEDDQGRPIDTSTKLPAAVGGAEVANAADMARILATGDAFTNCMAKNLIAYALAEPAVVKTDSCSTRAITTEFNAGDRSFGALVRAVAASKALTHRSAGR